MVVVVTPLSPPPAPRLAGQIPRRRPPIPGGPTTPRPPRPLQAGEAVAEVLQQRPHLPLQQPQILGISTKYYFLSLFF